LDIDVKGSLTTFLEITAEAFQGIDVAVDVVIRQAATASFALSLLQVAIIHPDDLAIYLGELCNGRDFQP
jgi:hypothetical protein